MLLPKLDATFKNLSTIHIREERKAVLHVFIDYLNAKLEAQTPIKLIYICTHNSRRSTMAQLWTQVLAYWYNVPMSCYSGGTEVTAFNPRAVHIMRNLGFKMADTNGDNPVYSFKISDHIPEITAYSKLYNDAANPTEGFAAVMTCDHADINCPIIHGSEKRIALPYEDPKAFDDSELEQIMYKKRSLQIASELNYVFSKLNIRANQ